MSFFLLFFSHLVPVVTRLRNRFNVFGIDLFPSQEKGLSLLQMRKHCATKGKYKLNIYEEIIINSISIWIRKY